MKTTVVHKHSNGGRTLSLGDTLLVEWESGHRDSLEITSFDNEGHPLHVGGARFNLAFVNWDESILRFHPRQPMTTALQARKEEIVKALDGCWCDDGRGEPECQKCTDNRVELARVQALINATEAIQPVKREPFENIHDLEQVENRVVASLQGRGGLWPDSEIIAKMAEELGETNKERRKGSQETEEIELGDLQFGIICYCAARKIPFSRMFRSMLKKQGITSG
jgi:phosphoribosyl-ATP pyrophosphohydrolase